MTRETLFMKAINEGLDQAMERDERVVLLGEDISGGVNVEHLENNNEDAWGGVMGITRGLMPKYGRERVIDTPISEHGYLSASVGMALTGLRPVPELMFNDFIGFCFDALLGQASKMRYMFGGKAKVPMVVRTMHGAGASAAAQHSGSYYGLFGSIPGIKVVVPATPYDAKGLKGEVPEEYYTVPIGKAAVRREGKDLTIVTIGKMLYVAYEVADRLAKDNISVEVIDLRTVAPWDEETVLNSVKKTGRLIIVDEANPHNNTATDIASVVSDKAFDYLDGPVKCVCAPNTPVPFATNLEQAYIPDADKVLKVADELIQDLKG